MYNLSSSNQKLNIIRRYEVVICFDFGDYVTSQPELTYTAYAPSYPMFWQERKVFVFISLNKNLQ